MPLSQDAFDHYVNTEPREAVENDKKKYHFRLHNGEQTKKNMENDIIRIESELVFVDSGIWHNKTSLEGLAESFRKIGREIPKSPYSTAAGQEGSFNARMGTVAAGCSKTLSEPAANPYVISGQPSPY